ncbi:hypothetical protein [Streptomyces hypolithicus]
MKHTVLELRPGRGRLIAAASALIAAGALAFVTLSGGSVDRPERPGSGLAEQLSTLRGANDLVRASSAVVGRDPALYPTAYRRMESALTSEARKTKATPPPIRPAALATLARTDVLDTPAWRAHYVCLAVKDSKGADAADVLERGGLRSKAESEALSYLRKPDAGDDALTSLATRAAFLQTLTCLGKDDGLPRAALSTLARDAARTGEPVPTLYATDALKAAGVRARPTRALQRADVLHQADCKGIEPMQRAALALLKRSMPQETRACLLPSLDDPDAQTRWLIRRALTSPKDEASLPAPVGGFQADGLVAKSPAQLGTLTATYNAARALTASAQVESTPEWLKQRLQQMSSDSELDSSDRVLLAMTCHRLVLKCGAQAEDGRKEAARLKVPTRLTDENQRKWYGAMAARAEFGLGCISTTVELPKDGRASLSKRSLRVVAVLAEAGCEKDAARLTKGRDLVGQVRTALRDGDLITASDAFQAALASEQSIPQSLYDELPALLDRYRTEEDPDLHSATPGGPASAQATMAAYYTLA